MSVLNDDFRLGIKCILNISLRLENMERTIAIITTYYPKSEHLGNIITISKQVDLIIVCDNSPNDNYELFKNINNLRYVFWNQNLGLSTSFNNILKDKKYGWSNNDNIVFFDQDSFIPENHIMSLVSDYESLEKEGLSIGCVGPFFFNKSMGKIEIPKLYETISTSVIRVKSIITSSMLCKYGKLQEIGFWNEKLFLDMADWDLCWRLIEKGYFCYMSRKSIMEHSVGEGKKKVLFFNLRVGKPFREYYQTRDCLYLLQEKYVPWNFRLRFMAMILVRPLLHILFLDVPRERARYIYLGIRDFCKNKHGEIPAN